MKKVIIISILTLALCALAFNAGAYTLSGSISGAINMGGISYAVAINCDGGVPPPNYIGIVLFGNGSYTIDDVPAGDYIVIAFQDRDNNQWISLNDYYGWYGDQLPEVLQVSGNMSGLNITVAPIPTTTISGHITYTGTATGLILVEAATDIQFTQGNQYTVVMDSTGAGEYTVYVTPGNYYIRSVKDSDHNLAYSPGEPLGIYGFPGTPTQVDVTSNPATNIDFTLYDPAPVTLTMTPQGAPITIPASGGQFTFQVSISAQGIFPTPVDAWIDVVLPNGSPYGPLINRAIVIPPGVQINRTLTQTVPGIAPAGEYTYRGFVGEFPFIMAAGDSFPFTKAGADHGASGSNWNLTGWNDENEFSVQSSQFSVLNSSPNPFNASTALSFKLQAASNVTLAVYDISGREVAVLAQGFYPAGAHQAEWEASKMASGVYFARLRAEGVCLTRKILLVK